MAFDFSQTNHPESKWIALHQRVQAVMETMLVNKQNGR